MNTVFDDPAREIAMGISRRDALKRMGGSLAGLLLASLGIKKAYAAVSCGTCQGCDPDTSTCASCNPAASQTLCSTVNGDGSYLRLVS